MASSKGKQRYPDSSAKILELLKKSRDGYSIDEIREQLGDEVGSQSELPRRLRQLDPFFIIERTRRGKHTVYVLRGVREQGDWMYESISKTLRAKILHKAGARCQMCGKTAAEDNVRLHIDHKIPQSWGGKTNEENLQALCSACNEGKRDFFASFDSDIMKKIVSYPSVHSRIAHLLKAKQGEWVDCDLIELAANSIEFQDDWKKRLRELRYLGLKIESRRRKINKRVISEYRLLNWVKLPEDPSAATRAYENSRAKKKRNR